MNNKLQLFFFSLLIFVSFCFSQDVNKSQRDSSSVRFLEDIFQKIKDSKGKTYEYKSILAEKTGISINSLNKKVIYLHSWFAACSPCIAEFKPLNDLYNRFSSNKDFKIISITYENEDTIAKFRKKYGIKYTIVRVTEEDCRKLNLMSGFPTNILLDRNMVISDIYFGGKGSEVELNSFFKHIVSSDIDGLLNNKSVR